MKKSKTEIREKIKELNTAIESLENKISMERNQKNKESLQSVVNELREEKDYYEEQL